MNVSVQHRHRAEAAQSTEELFRIPGAPAPGLVDRPERHVREYDDRRAGRAMLQIRSHPSELLVAQSAETARLELQHVDQSDEVHARMIEAVVALVVGGFTESIEVFRDGRIGRVVLARYRVHLGGSQAAE